MESNREGQESRGSNEAVLGRIENAGAEAPFLSSAQFVGLKPHASTGKAAVEVFSVGLKRLLKKSFGGSMGLQTHE